MVRFGDDTWKFWRTKFERFKTVTLFSGSSGMEFWLGGLGAIRFLRPGAVIAWLLLIRWWFTLPEESDEFSEFVELYGDTDDIVCGRAVERLSCLLKFVRNLTGASNSLFLFASFISFRPTSPIVSFKSNICVSSAGNKCNQFCMWK